MKNEFDFDTVVRKVADTLIRAASSFRPDQAEAYTRAIAGEDAPAAAWVMETIARNAQVAEKCHSPLCDDTGIPHVILEVGAGRSVESDLMSAVYEGIAIGLWELPGRPMAIQGDDVQRLDQSGGLNPDPSALAPTPFLLLPAENGTLRLHILMQGGGPEIRAKTYRVFHEHKVSVILDEVVDWAIEAVQKLGCTPCTLAVGVGRSHFEASSMMLQAMAFGNYSKQNDLELEITNRVNKSEIGPLGLRGIHSVLATFLKVGSQRASGVRIVCMRPCCCMEPRVASIDL